MEADSYLVSIRHRQLIPELVKTLRAEELGRAGGRVAGGVVRHFVQKKKSERKKSKYHDTFFLSFFFFFFLARHPEGVRSKRVLNKGSSPDSRALFLILFGRRSKVQTTHFLFLFLSEVKILLFRRVNWSEHRSLLDADLRRGAYNTYKRYFYKQP